MKGLIARLLPYFAKEARRPEEPSWAMGGNIAYKGHQPVPKPGEKPFPPVPPKAARGKLLKNNLR